MTACIVEDQPEIRQLLAARVKAMPNVECLGTFGSGEEALEALPQLKPTITIMDIGLPGMTGVECMATLTDRGYSGDFLMFTVFDHDEKLFRALELGASGYILKGEGAAGVERGIAEYQNGGAPMSRSIAQRVLRSFQAPKNRSKSEFEELTEQQYAILTLLAQGLLNKEIASRLGIAEATVKQHNVRMYRKLSVNNRAEAIRLYLTL